mmetsp:Transcript_39431/g.50863  ORF Transcript_39431/g.50863 Transcript_39431/m.50863 type:complete len:265 (-) Transcript_39431:112-906(-)
MADNKLEVREWWQETPNQNLTRRGGVENHNVENVMLPPRPSEVADFHDISFMDDDAFADDQAKKAKFAFSMTFPGLRRSLQTICLLLFLVAIGFFAGYEMREKTIASGSNEPLINNNEQTNTGNNKIQTNEEEFQKIKEEEKDLTHINHRPLCGSEYSIKGGVGYGGHNAGLGCVNAGRLTWAGCISTFEKRTKCTAASYKDNECWLHDRHQSDWWSDQKGDLYDYAPHNGKKGELHVPSGGLVGKQQGSTLIVRLVSELDPCN